MNEPTKQCTKCGVFQPATIDYFPPNKKAPDGLAWKCRDCFRQYFTEWRENNRERIQASNKRWKKRNPDKVKASTRRQRQRHAEERRDYNRRYREEHPERVRELKRRERKSNPQRERKRINRWRKNNHELIKMRGREYTRRRETLKRGLPCDFTTDDEVHALEYWHGCCAVCGKSLRDLFGETVPHLDHWIALSDIHCPGTISTNMVPLCKPCNLEKHNKHPERWLIERFGERKARQIIARIEQYFEHVKNR